MASLHLDEDGRLGCGCFYGYVWIHKTQCMLTPYVCIFQLVVSLCMGTSTCSCLYQAWLLSGQQPPPCSQTLLQGFKITSLSMLPGLWNNKTPGFPITAAPANGDRTKNMCWQRGARGRGREEGQQRMKQMAKVRPTGATLGGTTCC